MRKNQYTYDSRKFWLYCLVFETVFASIFISVIFTLGFFTSKELDENQLLFEYPTSFFLFLLIPFFYFLQYRAINRRNKMVSTLANPTLQSYLFQPVNLQKILVQFLLFRTIVVLLIISLASPIFGKKKQNTLASNLELVICLDVSNSMANALNKEINLQRLEIQLSEKKIKEIVEQIKLKQAFIKISEFLTYLAGRSDAITFK